VSEKAAKELGSKLEEVQLGRSSAEANLAVEKRWRASLQVYVELQERYAALQETVSDEDIALVEMGKKLSVSQQKIAEMKDECTMTRESVWWTTGTSPSARR